MDKKFTPSNYEIKIYKNWLDKGYFKTKVNKDKKPFTIIMPPPNITSRLHIGHVFGLTLMDSITRFKRMQGYEALFLPGCDHAAIATEVKVVDRLAKQGLKKEDLGREKFIEEMYKWYDEYGTAIQEQFKLVGISADWDKYAFTLDEKRNKSVRHAFVELYKNGLIYQGSRVTNLCVHCKTALSDIEVEYEENNGHLWHIKYKIENSSDFITVATTRPETIVGDVAVAVNPNDKRYTHLVGKNVVLPIINKLIPIITDDYVDQAFGTGVVKITPAHDPNDFEVGLRHNLDPIQIMGIDGLMNENAGKYKGLSRFECRKQIISDIDGLGQLVKIENHKNNVGHCHRCKEVVEPIISKQWYVKMQDLAEPAIKVVKEKDIKYVPTRFEKMYLHWMENIKDWCISRQIWSGHRIPVQYCQDCNEIIVEHENVEKCPKCGSVNLTQDPDSLDTWFSSALWPFSTLGWPEKTAELDYFYPTNLMITAYDIIPFWVARMIFSGLYYTKQKPFTDVLIHGLIRDSQGRKMSKSLGNGIDPIEIIDKYGADTLRLTLLYGVGVGQDSRYIAEKTESMSNFFNKLWNASRFVIENSQKIEYKKLSLKEINLTLYDKWMLTELNDLVKYITKRYEKYDLGLVASTLYEFIWNKFCDWYIESSKVKLNSESEKDKNEAVNVLVYVLDKLLKLLHPLAPLVTEEIFLNMPNASETIMLESFPTASAKLDYKHEFGVMNEVIEVVKMLRNLRAQMKIADNVKTDVLVVGYKDNELVNSVLKVIAKLSNAKSIKLVKESELPTNHVFVVNKLVKLIIPTDDLIDSEKEKERLTNELANIENELKRAKSMLSNTGFVAKAPQQLIIAEQEKVAKFEELRLKVQESLSNLK